MKKPWQCKFPGCPRYSDETYCFVCEQAMSAAKKATPETVARMAFALRAVGKPGQRDLVEREARLVLVDYDKETK